jgi:hypothetical protein
MPGTFRPGSRDLVGQRLHAVVSQGNGLRVERIRLHDVGAGLEILAMDLLDNGGLREVQQVVVPFLVLLPIFEPLATKRGLVQLPLLDHGPHGSVEDQNALLQ